MRSVEHRLHHARVGRRRRGSAPRSSDSSTWPSRARGVWQLRHLRQTRRRTNAAICRRSATMSGRRCKLLASDSSLDVGHPVVVPEHRMLLEDDRVRAVPLAVVHAHPVLAKQAERRVEFRIVGGQHPAVTGTDHLARMEREAGDSPVRPADLLPGAVPEDLAADCAGGVLDDGRPWPSATSRRRAMSQGIPT